ncbi:MULTISPECIES: GNAT family N-acetyltransferase [Lysobacter]|uniref:GNAT family N-acetyltransferase n=1 Tax=Lysobacter TaxID=68 RepID=UPI001F23FDD7|nr:MULTISPECIES: GNAT family N-acetyltransferase [Lysobacter]UJB18108.1 GNAT family N-acetyltransferase [Lysobacter capsici]UJQ28169.1 GNAT family N-acetyltransferase [Lysobacter gummosus]
MSDHVLDNPIWQSLSTRHRDLALGQGDAARYPASIAPFLGVARHGEAMDPSLAALVPPGDTALLLGRAPRVGPGWELRHMTDLAQMICPDPIAAADAADIVELGPDQRDDVLALTALVYPHYFRPHTMDLGRYFGIYQGDRLAAMAGERMGTHDYTELSAICTHPDFLGRGYARRLLVFLSNDNHARGRIPFLHVSHENPRAIELYERNGYRLRRDIPFWALRRVGG